MGKQDKRKPGRLLYGLLFAALGLLVWLLLAGYTEADRDIKAILGSPLAGLFIIVLFSLLGFLSFRISTWLNTRYMLNVDKRWKVAVAYALVMLLFLLITYSFLVAAKLLAGLPHPLTFPNGGMRILLVVWCVEMVVLGLLLANRAMAQSFDYRQRVSRMQEENIAARYSALQGQLNPHFLFNSFNTLVAEIEYNPARAVRFTRRLSDVYRYVLQVQKQKLVTLDEELSFAEAFLYLHEVRLGECIHCSFDVSAEDRECRLPPLTLQLLFENVIKHNSVSTATPMHIKVGVGDGWLTVVNDLHPKAAMDDSTGVGLSNLSNRCRMIVGRDIQITRSDTSFTVKIPLIYE